MVHTSHSNRVRELNWHSSTCWVNSYDTTQFWLQPSLCVQEFKTNLIELITTRFIQLAQKPDIHIVIDSASLTNPPSIRNNNITTQGQISTAKLTMLHGNHTIQCHSRDCLVFALDTDIWVYGRGLWEAGWLKIKISLVNEEMLVNLLGAQLQIFLLHKKMFHICQGCFFSQRASKNGHWGKNHAIYGSAWQTQKKSRRCAT